MNEIKNKIIGRINERVAEIQDHPKDGRFYLPVQLAELSGLRRARAIVEAAFSSENTDWDQALLNKILEASRQNPEGFTFDLYTNDLLKIDYGYVVAIIDTQDSNVSANLPSVLRAARKHNLHLVGGWWDEKEEKYYYDACAWFEDFSEAVAFAKTNKQKAIYNYEEKVVIDLRVKSC